MLNSLRRWHLSSELWRSLFVCVCLFAHWNLLVLNKYIRDIQRVGLWALRGLCWGRRLGGNWHLWERVFDGRGIHYERWRLRGRYGDRRYEVRRCKGRGQRDAWHAGKCGGHGHGQRSDARQVQRRDMRETCRETHREKNEHLKYTWNQNNHIDFVSSHW